MNPFSPQNFRTSLRSALLGASGLALLPLAGQAQITLSGANPTYVQAFNSLTTSTAGATFINNSTIPGVFASRSGSGGDIVASDGSTGLTTFPGNLYSFGTGTIAERALGDVGSGNASAGDFAFGLYFRNNTGATLTTLMLTYTGEQWRNGGTTNGATPAVQVVDFSYRVSNSAISTLPTAPIVGTATTAPTPANYTAVSSLNFTTPVNLPTATALDGNDAANRTTTTVTFSVNVPSGSYLMLRWGDPNHDGADDGFGLDDVTASFVTSVPTDYYTKANTSPNLLASYGTGMDGSGTPPPNFTNANTTYHIANAGTHQVSAAWSVSGSGSTVNIDNGATLTIIGAASTNYTGPLSLSAASLLVQQNAAPAITFGAVDPASTIEYSRGTTYTLTANDIPATGFGNLALRNNNKTLPATTSDILVRGNLLLDNLMFNGASASPFTGVSLMGDLTATNTVTFPNTTGRITLTTTNTSTAQTFTGNGNLLSFYRLITGTGSKGVILANNTNLELGNNGNNRPNNDGGGYALATGSTLAVGNNTLSFFSSGKASITTGAATTGVLVLTAPGSANAGSSLVFSASYGTVTPGFTQISPGTLLLDAASQALNNLTIDLRSAVVADRLLTLPGNMTIFGTLSLTNGRLGLTSGATFNINGSLIVASSNTPVPVLVPGSANDISFQGAGTISGTLFFSPNNVTLGSLSLNRDDVPVINIGTSFRTNLVQFTQGIILMAPNTILTANANTVVQGGNPRSYINAFSRAVVINTATRTGSVSFPLGVSGNKYRPYVLNVNASATNTTGTTYYSAFIFDGPPMTRTLPSTLKRVSSIRYYKVGPTSTNPVDYTYSATIQFGSDDYVTDLPTLRIAKSNTPENGAWTDIGNSNTTGVVSDGTITSNSFAAAGFAANTTVDFVLASNNTPTNPLPVVLTYFAGERTAGGVALSWGTASEHNSQKFVVERSLDGETFVPVTEVAAAGISLAPLAYTSLDNTAPATQLYYRLRQVDFDGTVAYSKVVAIAGGNESRVAYPNPTTDVLTVPGAAGQTVEVQDALGRSVRRTTLDAGGQLHLGDLPAGVYLLRAPGQRVQRIQKN